MFGGKIDQVYTSPCLPRHVRGRGEDVVVAVEPLGVVRRRGDQRNVEGVKRAARRRERRRIADTDQAWREDRVNQEIREGRRRPIFGFKYGTRKWKRGDDIHVQKIPGDLRQKKKYNLGFSAFRPFAVVMR